MLKLIKNTAMIIAVIAAVYYSLIFPQAIGQAVKSSVDRCLTIIVPSMFIFLCITTFISKSNIHSILSKPLKFISEKLFRLPKEGFAILLLSMLSGYPAGIKLVNDNFQQGILSAQQAKIMSCFCFFSGPAFITGTAATCIYPNSNAGLLIFLSCISGGIITAAVFTRFLSKPLYTNCINNTINANQIIPSVKSASSAMLQMCVMIAAFGGFIAILNTSGIIDIIVKYINCIFNFPTDITKHIIYSFLEISNIVSLPPMQIQLFPVVIFLISFGGICVHMQIAALADSNFSVKSFFIARILSSSISAVTGYFLMPFLNLDTTCNVSFKAVSENSYSPLPSILLIIMMIMLLGLFKEKKKD